MARPVDEAFSLEIGTLSSFLALHTPLLEAMTYPPMPWHLVTRGVTLATLHLVEVERARALVPPGLRVVSVLPGYTVGGLFVAEYGAGSGLLYNEVIAAGALVWHERRPRPWIAHLYVDSHDSVRGGRDLLGAPKEFAPFARDARDPGAVVVGHPERPICRFRMGRKWWLWRQRLRIVALHRDVRHPSGAAVVVQGSELRGRGGVTHARVEIPPDSPLHPLGFSRPLLALCARGVEAVLGGAPFHPARTIDLDAGNS
jgi:acetoacetate decarboxylase